MTIGKSTIIALGFVIATAAGAHAATSAPYLPYTGHGGLDIVTDAGLVTADPVITGSIEPGCSIHLPYTGHGGLEIVADCDPITTGSIAPAPSPYLPYTGHGGLDIVE